MAHPASVLPAAPDSPEAVTGIAQPVEGESTTAVSVHDLVEDVSIDGMCGVY
jgi:mycofactocin precursor